MKKTEAGKYPINKGQKFQGSIEYKYWSTILKLQLLVI